MLTSRVYGEDALVRRGLSWTAWLQQITSKISSIKKEAWRYQQRILQAKKTPASTLEYRRGGGFVEKVKRPVFSGKGEDYQEFKSQFVQLCKGEGYTPIIELAQMREKLP